MQWHDQAATRLHISNLCACRYDIEDALIMNRSSLDRGFGRCMLMRKHGTVLKRYPNRAADQIIAPDATKVLKPAKSRMAGQTSQANVAVHSGAHP